MKKIILSISQNLYYKTYSLFNYKDCLDSDLDEIEISNNLGCLDEQKISDLLQWSYDRLRNGGVLKLNHTKQEEFDSNTEGTIIGLTKENFRKLIHDNFFFVEKFKLYSTKLRKKCYTHNNKLVILGCFLSETISSGILCAEIASRAIDRGVDTNVYGIALDHAREDLNPIKMDGWTHDYLENELVLLIDGPWVAQVIARDNLNKDKQWGYFYHELEKLPDIYINPINDKFEKVYTISEFCKNGFIKGGLQTVPKVIHHGYDPKIYYPKDKNRKNKEFTFISVAFQQKRKGTFELIKAFINEFGSTGESVRLIIKDADKQSEFNKEYLASLFYDYSKILSNSKITVIEESYDSFGLAELVRSADCFVLPTHAEGFGIPILEAKANKLPVITTAYGGQTDFCKTDDTFFVDYTLYDRDDVLKSVGGFFARPSIKDLQNKMRYVYENREIADNYAELSYSRIKDMTWENVLNPFIDDIITKLNDMNRM